MPQPSPRRLSLLNSFRKLDLGNRNILADIESPLQLGLATLTLAEDHAKVEYLSLEHIVAALEAAGVAVKRRQLARAMPLQLWNIECHASHADSFNYAHVRSEPQDSEPVFVRYFVVVEKVANGSTQSQWVVVYALIVPSISDHSVSHPAF